MRADDLPDADWGYREPSEPLRQREYYPQQQSSTLERWWSSDCEGSCSVLRWITCPTALQNRQGKSSPSIVRATHFRSTTNDKFVRNDNILLFQELLNRVHRSDCCLWFINDSSRDKRKRWTNRSVTFVIGKRSRTVGSLPLLSRNVFHVQAIKASSSRFLFNGSAWSENGMKLCNHLRVHGDKIFLPRNETVDWEFV